MAYFLCSVLAVRRYAKEDCYSRIEELTAQAAEMFCHAMDQDRQKMTVFAGILAANASNADEQLQKYMEHFCKTQDFAAICIHRADNSIVSYGEHPHHLVALPSFDVEAQRLPYVSPVYSVGDFAEEKYVYQAVPIVRNGKTEGILYGYITLDRFADYIVSAGYDGKSQFYIVDGASGDFLLDTWHEGALGNLFSEEMDGRETKDGYRAEDMRNGVIGGKTGYFVFRSKTSGEWFYTYYMPLGVNTWSMQMTIDEPTAFDAYRKVSVVMFALFASIIALMVVHLLWVMFDSVRVRKNDVARLKQATYINRVRRDLINAHNNDEFVEHALKAVLNEVRAETVLLASFADRMAEQLYYFPSEDRGAITELFGNHNIHDDFPQFFDRLSDGESILFDMADAPTSISETTAARMRAQGIVNLMMAPIIDNAGLLRGMLCAVNVKPMPKTCELLECVTYDFYMALMNIKNHKIIRHMGEIDYLTDMKNRNSYEAALHTLEVYDCDTLSCVFIDANGLHEINNTQGHKAGDLMLCAVSDEIRRVFGVQYTYRIGGDEFLCFVANADAAKLSEDANTVTAVLAAKGYYVSVGCAERRRDASGKFDVVGVVADAEARMYEEKREYYKRNDLVWERGQKRKNDDCHQSREE